MGDTEGDKPHFAAESLLSNRKPSNWQPRFQKRHCHRELGSCRPRSALTYLSPTAGLPSVSPQATAPGSLVLLLSPSPAADTCSGGGRTAESGHLRAGSHSGPGGRRGCLEEERGCCFRRRRGADAVAMVMELRSCPLSAQQLPGRGLRAAPANLAKKQGCKYGEAGSQKGHDWRLRARPACRALLTSAPLLLSHPRRDAARPRRSAQRALAACRARPAAARPLPAALRAALPARLRAGAAPAPQPRPLARPVSDGCLGRWGGGGQAAQRPNPACSPARPVGGASGRARRPPASPARRAMSMLRLCLGVRSCPPGLGDWDAGESKGSFPDPRERRGYPLPEWGKDVKLLRGARGNPVDV